MRRRLGLRISRWSENAAAHLDRILQKYLTRLFNAPPGTVKEKLGRRGHTVLVVLTIATGLLWDSTRSVVPTALLWTYKVVTTKTLPDLKWDLPMGVTIYFVAVAIVLSLFFVPPARATVGRGTLRCAGVLIHRAAAGADYLASRKGLASTGGFALLAFFVASLIGGRILNAEHARLFEQESTSRRSLLRTLDQTPVHRISIPAIKMTDIPNANTISEQIVRRIAGPNKCLDSLRLEAKTYSDRTTPFYDTDPEFLARLCLQECEICAFRKVFRAKCLLFRSQQGRIIEESIRAHNLLVPITSSTPNHWKEVLSSLHYAVGNCYAHYVQRYDLLATLSWRDINHPPDISVSSPPGAQSNLNPLAVTVAAVFSEAVKHYDDARRAGESHNPDFAKGRFENSMTDLLYRLIRSRLGTSPNLDERDITTVLDNLLMTNKLAKDKIDEMIGTGIMRWIEQRENNLVQQFSDSRVVEALLTCAQLKCLRVRILELTDITQDKSEQRGQILHEAVELCFMAAANGYVAPEFYSYPEYMGICPMLLDAPTRTALQDKLGLVGQSIPPTPPHTCTW